MDEMERYSQFQGFYAVINNLLIHWKNGELNLSSESRGYKCAFLPLRSPEINPIEQSDAAVKR